MKFEERLAEAIRSGIPPQVSPLFLGTVTSVDGTRVYVQPDGAEDGNVVGPIEMVGG